MCVEEGSSMETMYVQKKTHEWNKDTNRAQEMIITTIQ